jgi:hypothetical protein
VTPLLSHMNPMYTTIFYFCRRSLNYAYVSLVAFSAGFPKQMLPYMLQVRAVIILGYIYRTTAYVVWWSGFLATDPEIPGSTQPCEDN